MCQLCVCVTWDGEGGGGRGYTTEPTLSGSAHVCVRACVRLCVTRGSGEGWGGGGGGQLRQSYRCHGGSSYICTRDIVM